MSFLLDFLMSDHCPSVPQRKGRRWSSSCTCGYTAGGQVWPLDERGRIKRALREMRAHVQAELKS